MDDDGDETPERRKEMLALRQAGYGDRVAVSLGNVPTGPVKDYSFRGRNALRKPAGIKSGSRPVKSANELWASHKDEPGKNSRDRTPNGSIRNSNGALGALGAGGFNTGGSPRSSNGGSREGSTRPRNISFNDAPSEVLRPEVAVHIGSGGSEKSDANKDGASTSASTNQTPHGSPFKAPGNFHRRGRWCRCSTAMTCGQGGARPGRRGGAWTASRRRRSARGRVTIQTAAGFGDG